MMLRRNRRLADWEIIELIRARSVAVSVEGSIYLLVNESAGIRGAPKKTRAMAKGPRCCG